MNFNNQIPEWKNKGTEPSTELKNNGFQAGQKPPAAVFNWFWSLVSKAIPELQQKLIELKQAVEITTGDLDTYTDVGMFTYSAANSASINNTPEQAQSTMLVLPRLMADSEANRVQVVLTQTNHFYMRHLAENIWSGWTRLRNSNEVIPVVYGGTGSTDINGIRNTINLPETCVLTEDWNTATKTGWYMSNGENKNAPTGSWFFGFVIAHNSQYVLQEVYAFTNSSGKATDLTKYIRSCYAGNWGDWINVTVQRTVPEGARLEYIKTLSSDVQQQLNNIYNHKMDTKPAFIELTPAEGTNHGGYIDFHFSGSTDDYTSRIMEEKEGQLRILADTLRLSGILQISDGECGLYGDDHTVNVVTKSDVTNDYKRSIQLMNKAYEANIANALILINKDSSGTKNYKIYGEHNITTPLSELNNLVGKKGTGTNAEIFNDYSKNTASGEYAHAQNQDCHANGDLSDAGGLDVTVNAYGGFGRGMSNVIDGMYTNGLGMGLLVNGEAQTGLGKYNTLNTNALLLVGCGSDEDTRANALRVGDDGKCYGSSAFLASGADYAEMFEWQDGNPDNEDRRGLFVTLDGEKIRLANSTDDILGVVSATPSVVGDTRSEEWHGKFKKDIFGADIWETVEVEEKVLPNGNVIPAHTEKRRVLNPDYDPTRDYTSRDERKEWAAVGIVGKLIMIDDGTCEVNGYCNVGENGIATKAENKTAYRVISRIDDTHIRVFIK